MRNMRKAAIVAAVLTMVMATPAGAAELSFTTDECIIDASQFVFEATAGTATAPKQDTTTIITPPTTVDSDIIVVPGNTTTTAPSGTASGSIATPSAPATSTPSATTVNNYYYYTVGAKQDTTAPAGTVDSATTVVEVTKVATKKLAKPTIRVYASKGGFVVGIDAVKGATGYQIRYIQGGNQYSLKTTATAKKVFAAKKGNTSVYVRAYSKSAGKTVYSKWSQCAKTNVK